MKTFMSGKIVWIRSIASVAFGFGIPADQIQVVAALHGLSNLLNFEAAAWVTHMNTPAAQAVDREFGFGPAVRDNK
jgi:hypothetical protein